MNMPADDADVLKHTAEIVVAFLNKNPASAAEVADLVRATHLAFAGVASVAAPDIPNAEAIPAVPVSESITPDYLICLECGRKLQALKQHLAKHALTPEKYRRKWGLAYDYPVVTSSLSAKRGRLALESKFGRRPRPKRKTHQSTS
jgi:predicted transcriptional regulator